MRMRRSPEPPLRTQRQIPLGSLRIRRQRQAGHRVEHGSAKKVEQWERSAREIPGRAMVQQERLQRMRKDEALRRWLPSSHERLNKSAFCQTNPFDAQRRNVATLITFIKHS